MKKYTINTEEPYKNDKGEWATMTGSHEVLAESELEAEINVKKLLFSKEKITSIHETVISKKKI